MPPIPPALLAIAILVAGASLMLLLVVPLTKRPALTTGVGLAAVALAVVAALLYGGGPLTPSARLAVLGVSAAAAVGLLLLPTVELHVVSQRPEAAALLLLGAGGGIALAVGTDLLQVVLGVETLSLSVAVLVALGRGERPLEAAFRYFVLAAISLAIMLYGVGLIYVGTGSLAIPASAAFSSGSPMLYAGATLVLLGLVFELAVVPLQWGLLDVYTAAPPAVTGYAMATAKLAAVIALVRLAASAGEPLAPVFVALGVLSIVWGTLGAMAQRELRRMLAYSAVVHAGFLALALGSGPSGQGAAVFYVVVYAVTALLVFAALSGLGVDPLRLRDVSNATLGPLRSAGLALGLFSLAGIPPAPGFWAKLAVLGPAWEVAGVWPTAIAVLGGVAGVLYYLRPLPDLLAVTRKPEDGSGDAQDPPVDLLATRHPLAGSAVLFAGLIVVIVGVAPGLVWSLTDLVRGG